MKNYKSINKMNKKSNKEENHGYFRPDEIIVTAGKNVRISTETNLHGEFYY